MSDTKDTVEPLGFMNAGYVNELRQERIQYGYVYQIRDVGAETPVYTAPPDVKEMESRALELQDLCDRQALMLGEQDALLLQALEALEVNCAGHTEGLAKDAILAIKKRIGVV